MSVNTMLRAAETGDLASVEAAIAAGVDVLSKDGAKNTALHLAAYRGHPEIVKHLLLHKADPNIGNENNDLPTHLAALARQMACLKVLLDPGINPAKVNIDAHDAQGYCALHYACGEGHLEVARALLQTYGADVESRNNDGLTPIMCAVQQGHKPVAEMLISVHPTCIEATNNSGDSCLHYATIAEGTGMLEMLLRHGADPYLKNKDGLTPLHEAVVEKQAESTALLKRVMNGMRSETGAMMNAATRRVLVGRILDSSAGSASTDCHTNHNRAGIDDMPPAKPSQPRSRFTSARASSGVRAKTSIELAKEEAVSGGTGSIGGKAAAAKPKAKSRILQPGSSSAFGGF